MGQKVSQRRNMAWLIIFIATVSSLFDNSFRRLTASSGPCAESHCPFHVVSQSGWSPWQSAILHLPVVIHLSQSFDKPDAFRMALITGRQAAFAARQYDAPAPHAALPPPPHGLPRRWGAGAATATSSAVAVAAAAAAQTTDRRSDALAPPPLPPHAPPPPPPALAAARCLQRAPGRRRSDGFVTAVCPCWRMCPVRTTLNSPPCSLRCARARSRRRLRRRRRRH